MTDAEFTNRMREVDRQLIDQNVRVWDRLILAYFFLTGKQELCVSAKDPRFGPFESPNLCHSVWDWYAKHYPTHATFGHDWGPRLMIIRGEVFQADIPIHFNPSRPLEAFNFIRDLTPALREMLSEDERAAIQTIYNGFFAQASDLAMNWTTWCAPPRPGLVSSLIHRGWGDLRASCQAFSIHDPTAVLFIVQQGPEKYLKAMILVDDPTLNEEYLRKKYGHRITKLLEKCTQIDSSFIRFNSHIHLLDYGPNIRYHHEAASPHKVVAITDLAHALCHAVAKRLLSLNP